MATLNQGLGVKAGGSGGGGGGTDTNLGNTDLTADATRTFDVNRNNLTFENSGTNILELDQATASVNIGGASPYRMPTARGTSGEILGLSDGSGTAAWRTLAVTTAPAQTQSGDGLIGATSLTAGEIYLFNNFSGTMTVPTGLTTSSSSVDARGWSTFTSFRQMSSSNQTIGTGTDLFLIKFVSFTAGTFDFYVVNLDARTGRAIASSAINRIVKVGTVTYGGKGESVGNFTSLELSLADGGVVASADSIYYLGISPVTSLETDGWEAMTMYVNPTETTLSFS